MSAPTTTGFIGGYIEFVREHNNTSIKTLAYALDVTYQYHWDIENGNRNVSINYMELVKEQFEMFDFWVLMPEYLKSIQEHIKTTAESIEDKN